MPNLKSEFRSDCKGEQKKLKNAPDQPDYFQEKLSIIHEMQGNLPIPGGHILMNIEILHPKKCVAVSIDICPSLNLVQLDILTSLPLCCMPRCKCPLFLYNIVRTATYYLLTCNMSLNFINWENAKHLVNFIIVSFVINHVNYN